jgi:hypothetical protein
VAIQQDSDHDLTKIEWVAATPWLIANRDLNRVISMDWAQGAVATLSVDDPSNGPGTDYTETRSVDPQTPWGEPITYVEFPVPLNITPGFEITLTDGAIAKTLIVSDISVTSVDQEADTVSGIADPSAPIEVWIIEPVCCTNRQTISSAEGSWTVDFSVPGNEAWQGGPFDISLGTGGVASSADNDGDRTEISWHANRPPIADAGGPYFVLEGTSVQLDGASSNDPDGDALTYEWDLDNDGEFDEAAGETTEVNFPDNGEYTISLRVTDPYGAEGTDTSFVTVGNVAPAVGEISAPMDPIAVGVSLTTSATFSDPGQDSWTATWDWGDGTTSAGTMSGFDVQGEHTYGVPGVYTLTLTVTDDDGGVGIASYQFVVVYDPEGGFVTGGGWIQSPASAYVDDPTLEGKANFGFVSKYRQGANVPSGQTTFHYRVADLNFHSDTYEWLVVAGSRAQFKGVGTINGEGEYRFILTASDADLNTNDAHDLDRFRIRIWWEDGLGVEHVVYDNQPGDDLDYGATTELGGGSIVIHK